MIDEQAIINYLKENKYKGVAFGFMPQDVKDWCLKHRFDRSLNIFDDDAWIVPDHALLCYSSDIYCLQEEYELKAQFKPHLQEFDIDEDGMFSFEGKRYYYREDARFETENRNKFKGFGGWLYEGKDFDLWTTVPHLRYGGCLYDYLRSDQNAYEKTVPIPIKICFWRYKE